MWLVATRQKTQRTTRLNKLFHVLFYLKRATPTTN